MTNEYITKTLNAIEDYSYKVYSEIDDIKEKLRVNEEVVDFLIDLSNTEELPQELRDKADKLWREIY